MGKYMKMPPMPISSSIIAFMVLKMTSKEEGRGPLTERKKEREQAENIKTLVI